MGKLKITDSDYLELRDLLHKALEVSGTHVSKISNDCQLWQLFYAACDFKPGFLNRLYVYLDDNNIESAMKHALMI